MTSWQGAKLLFQYELRRSWLGLLITMLFFTYISIVMMPLFKELLDNKTSNNVRWVGDLLYLTILPNMGFLMNRSYLKYWQKDPFTRKIAYWRTLPIGLTSIVISRMLQLITVLTIVGAYFFVSQYLLLDELRKLVTTGEYIFFALIWIGYALAIGSTYVIFEQLLSGKKYFAVCLGYIVGFAAISLISWLTDMEIVFRTIKAAQDQEVIWPIGSLLIGSGVTVAAGLWIRSKLAVRNLMS
ncbi:hypothetical protein ACFPYJ_09600 [Paenibacillus solisilvae]|uniref:ABC transporter permease n=1 Tax=Paenibacillus solisilvae TaxID=2486751 RepID=A0ABW0VWK8_9BACL